MATTNSFSAIDSFLEYFKEAKPYHTKLLEIIEEYQFFEDLFVCTCEKLDTTVTIQNTPLCKQTGFGLDYDDDCGYDAIDCCDLFDCDGGYGFIFDNSDILVDEPITSIDTTAVSVGVSGSHIADTHIQVKQILNSTTAKLNGDVSDLLNKHSIFLYVNIRQFSIVSNFDNFIILSGNQVDFIEQKRNFRIENSETKHNGQYTVRNVEYDISNNQTILDFVTRIPIANDELVGVNVKFKNSNPDIGIYQLESFTFDGTDTIVEVSGNSFDNVNVSDDRLGSFQFRTGLQNFREVDIVEAEDDYHTILHTEYNYSTNETVLYLDGDVSSYTVGNDTVKLYGYFFGSGFDGDEECSKPKETHIYSLLEEHLLILIDDSLMVPTPTPTPSVSDSSTPTPTPTPTPSISESVTPTPTPSPSGGGGDGPIGPPLEG